MSSCLFVLSGEADSPLSLTFSHGWEGEGGAVIGDQTSRAYYWSGLSSEDIMADAVEGSTEVIYLPMRYTCWECGDTYDLDDRKRFVLYPDGHYHPQCDGCYCKVHEGQLPND